MKPFSLIFSISIYMLFASVSLGSSKENKDLDSLIHVLETRSEKDSIQADLMHKIAYQSYTNNLELTKNLADELAVLSTEINYPKGLMQSFNLLGIYYDSKGEYERSLESHQKSLEIAIQNNHKKGISSAYNNLGIISEILGDYPDALNYYQQSLKIDNELQDTLGKSKTLLQVGSLYEYMSDTLKALQHYEQSLELALEIENDQIISYNLINIGYIKLASGDNVSAKPFFNQALEISERNNQQEGILLSCLMLGIVDKEDGNYKKAIEYTERSLDICRKTGSVANERYALFHLADAYFRMNMLSQAYSLAKQAYNPNDYCDESLQMTTTELLSDITAKQGKFRKAYEYHKEFKKLQDHSFNDENRRKISQIEYEYKLEKETQALELEQQKKEALFDAKQEQQIMLRNFILLLLVLTIILLITIFNNARSRRKANEILLNQKQQLIATNQLLETQKADLEKTSKELEIANQTKDKFFSIIAHDLRSPFTAVFGFSDILLESHHEFSESEMQTFLSKIKSGSESALILLENLFSWASSNSGTIKFHPEIIYLKDVADAVVSLYETASNTKNVQLRHHIKESDTLIADLDMLRTILRNLVSNSIKFTSAGDLVEIIFERVDQYSIIKVKDTGIGIEKDKIDQIFKLSSKSSSLGTNGEKGTGLGLVLCEEFAKKHGGKIEVNSEISKGTEITVYFPENQVRDFRIS